MPYALLPSGTKYYVINTRTGKVYSKEPMPKERAKKQLIALRIHTKE